MRLKRIMMSVCAGLFAGLGAAWPAAGAELKVQYGELAALVRTLVADAKVHIHNVPPQGLMLFMPMQQSHVALAGQQAPIEVPTEDGWAPLIGSYSYYVNNLDLTALAVADAPGAVRITMSFDGSGYKIVPSDDRLPSIAWSKPAVSFDLRPVKAGSSIALEATRVEVKGTLKPECTKQSIFCTYIALQEAKKKVKEMPARISAQIKDVINSPAVRDGLAKYLEGYLTLGSLGQVKVKSVTNADKSVTIGFCLQGC